MPISLVRSDGVIYPYDDEKFTYCPALVNSEPPVKKSRVEEIDQSASSISQIEQFNNEAATVSHSGPKFENPNLTFASSVGKFFKK